MIFSYFSTKRDLIFCKDPFSLPPKDIHVTCTHLQGVRRRRRRLHSRLEKASQRSSVQATTPLESLRVPPRSCGNGTSSSSLLSNSVLLLRGGGGGGTCTYVQRSVPKPPAQCLKFGLKVQRTNEACPGTK